MPYQREYPHIKFAKHWTLAPRVHQELGECDGFVRAISDIPLLPETRSRLLQVSLRKGARATTAIEGNTLSESEVALVAEGESLPPSKEYMEIEVRNILNAYNRLLEEVAVDGKADLITPQLLQRFHAMIGQDLGSHFDAIPGHFAERARFVLRYRAPDHGDLPELVARFCTWLAAEFRFQDGMQSFSDAVIQAIVSHVYIEWIHPFTDGNGRTGRLVEFYLLLRAGNPDIASHILSNHYNDTRAEYYRQLDRAGTTGDLSEFIAYAVQGLRDGLATVLTAMQKDQFRITWGKYIYDQFAAVKLQQRKRVVFVRQRRLALEMPLFRPLTLAEMVTASPELVRSYAGISRRTILRDIHVLEQLGLVEQTGDTYTANTRALRAHAPIRRLLRGPSRAASGISAP